MATLPIVSQLTSTINSLYTQIVSLLQNPTTIYNQYRAKTNDYPKDLFTTTQFTGSGSNNRTSTWGVNHINVENQLTLSKGIAQGTASTLRKSGIGDFCGTYTYMEHGGGSVNGDDESISGYGLHLTDSNGPEYVATVLKSPDNRNLNLSCSTIGWKKGMGRYLTLLKNADGTDAAVSSGMIKSFTPPNNPTTGYGTITIDTSVVPSTAWGQCTGYIVTPWNADQEQQVTFNVNVKQGLFDTQSVIAVYGGRRNERAKVVSVSPLINGQQTITALLRETYEDLLFPWIFQGGPVGTGITVSAYQKGDGSPGTQRFLVPIVGAINKNTLVYSANGVQGQQNLQYTYEIPIAIDGKSNAFKLYKCAEIIGAVNQSIQYTDDQIHDIMENGRFALLEANDILWNVGTTVECPPHYAIVSNISFVNYANNTGMGNGYITNYAGTSISGLFSARLDTNWNALSTYGKFGGPIQNGPKHTSLAGCWGNILTIGANNADTGCMIPGSTAFYFGAAGYDRNSEGYTAFKFDTKTREILIKIDQPNDAFVIQIANNVYSFSINDFSMGTLQNPRTVVIDNQGNITAKSFNVSK